MADQGEHTPHSLQRQLSNVQSINQNVASYWFQHSEEHVDQSTLACPRPTHYPHFLPPFHFEGQPFQNEGQVYSVPDIHLIELDLSLGGPVVEGVLVLGGVVSLPKQLGWRQAIFRGEGGVVGTPFVADELGFKLDET